MLEITGRDSDGELVALLVEWPPEQGEPPRIAIAPVRGKQAPAPGIGDRVLARLTKDGDGFTARVIKVLEKKPATVLGVVRGDRIDPIDKKSKELTLDPADVGKAKDGDLVSLSVTRSGRYGLEQARVAEVIGSMKSEKAVSLIAIHAHGIPHVFPADVLAEAEAARPASMQDREDWRDAAAGHHRPARRQGPRRRGPCRARSRPGQSRRLHRHRRHRRRRLVRAPRHRRSTARR